MWFRMRPVELDFLEKAPRRIAVEGIAALPRDLVWQALVDAASWPEWFPGVRSAGYRGEPPYGVGSIRVADVGGWRMEETLLAWDEGRRWAYRIDRSTAPLAKAQLECTELEDHADGTRVIWRFGIEPGLLLRITGPFFQGTVQRLLDRALRRLEARARASEAAAA